MKEPSPTHHPADAPPCPPSCQPQGYKRHKKRDLMKGLEGSLFPPLSLQLCDCKASPHPLFPLCCQSQSWAHMWGHSRRAGMEEQPSLERGFTPGCSCNTFWPDLETFSSMLRFPIFRFPRETQLRPWLMPYLPAERSCSPTPSSLMPRWQGALLARPMAHPGPSELLLHPTTPRESKLLELLTALLWFPTPLESRGSLEAGSS